MRILAVTFILAVLCASPPVRAQGGTDYFHGWGPRMGLTVNPDQVHLGAHFDVGRITPRLRFRPNFELGWGDNRTLGAINLEVNYLFNSRPPSWTPYVGGGLGINYQNVDSPRFGNRTDSDLGASLLAGIERPLSNGDRFFIETKVVMVDAPDLKLSVGWSFRY